MCASRNTDAGHGWLRLRVGQPGVLLLRGLGPTRWGSDGGDGPEVGQPTDVRIARLNTRIRIYPAGVAFS
jgi:hypothetical protein